MSYSALTTVLLASLTFAASGRSQEPEPLPLPQSGAKPKVERSDSRVTVIEKAPIHEGFAQPGAQIRGKGMTALKAPPLPVNEIPPEPKPEGTSMKWIPGYWAWDAERTDFIWVCGCYRNTPSDRTWEPGRWKETKKEWTYFPGYWRPADGKAIAANLPEPPAVKEEAPVAPKDNPNAMWVPGIWEYKDSKFEWQPGYWPASRERMIWQQAQYVATETGFAFVPGHWDYPLEERGVLFTPVSFSQTQREKRGWSYRPEYTISFGSNTKWGQGGAFDALHIGPNYNNYFAGDYSASAGLMNEGGSGDFQSWDATSPAFTNPLWQHYVRLNRADSGFAKRADGLDTTRLTGGKNPLAFVEGRAGCAPACAPVPRVQWVPTPVVTGYHYRR